MCRSRAGALEEDGHERIAADPSSGPRTLAAFEAGGPVAAGLPGAAYTSEAFLALENERVFTESWVFAGFAHELARPGDVMPVTVAGRPLPPRARCRARGPGLPQRVPSPEPQARRQPRKRRAGDPVSHITPGRTGSTARSSSLPTSAGAIRARSRAASIRGRHGLVPVRSATWHDWIFVNPSGDRTPLRGVCRPAPEPARGRRPRPGTPRRHHRLRRSGRELEAHRGELHRALPRPVRARGDHRTAARRPLHP